MTLRSKACAHHISQSTFNMCKDDMTMGIIEATTDVIETSLKYLGVPYVWGGTSPQGFDCSGFVQYVYAKHGVDLPRTTYYQENVGTKVSKGDLQPGDLLFFGSPSHHVTMYIGNGQMIEAPQTDDVVKISPLRSFTQARRVR